MSWRQCCPNIVSENPWVPWKPSRGFVRFLRKLIIWIPWRHLSINVTSLSSIPYWSNSEYWTQKRGNLHNFVWNPCLNGHHTITLLSVTEFHLVNSSSNQKRLSLVGKTDSGMPKLRKIKSADREIWGDSQRSLWA